MERFPKFPVLMRAECCFVAQVFKHAWRHTSSASAKRRHQELETDLGIGCKMNGEKTAGVACVRYFLLNIIASFVNVYITYSALYYNTSYLCLPSLWVACQLHARHLDVPHVPQENKYPIAHLSSSLHAVFPNIFQRHKVANVDGGRKSKTWLDSQIVHLDAPSKPRISI